MEIGSSELGKTDLGVVLGGELARHAGPSTGLPRRQGDEPRARKEATLADLPFHGEARIVGVRGSDASATRLRELGLQTGTRISFCHRAPLGDPRCFSFRGTMICLRKSEAARILIEFEDDA